MAWDEHEISYRGEQEQRGMELIGAAVKRRRLRHGLTQMDLERLTGVDQTIISRIERARRWGLSWRRFATLVAALGGLDFDPPPAPVSTGLDHQALTPNPYLARQAAAEAARSTAAAEAGRSTAAAAAAAAARGTTGSS